MTRASNKQLFRTYSITGVTLLLTILFSATAWAQTVLQDAANSLAPGSFVQITTTFANNNYFFEHGNNHALEFTANGFWDSDHKRIYSYVCGHEDRPQFAVYDEATNRWGNVNEGSHPEACHAYDHMGYDHENKYLYSMNFNSPRLYRAKMSQNLWTGGNPNWETLPNAPGIEGSVYSSEYFPELGGYVMFDPFPNSARLSLFKDGSWSTLVNNVYANGGPVDDTIHGHMEYIPQHKMIIFGGGEEYDAGDLKRLWSYDENGTFRRIADAPVGFVLNENTDHLIAEPVTGEVILYEATNDQLYAYNIPSNTWRNLNVSIPSGIADYYDASMTVFISDYGVIMFIIRSGGTAKTWLYKHAEGGGGNQRNLTPPEGFRVSNN